MGIDPGLAYTGYGVIEIKGNESRLLCSGTIVTEATLPLAIRLRRIHDELAGVLREWKPDAVAVESLFFCTNVKTAIAVAQARGVALLATATIGVELHEYSPLEVKLAVAGSGKAGKEQVQRMVKAILGLNELPKTSHCADALAVALCHAHSYRYRQMIGDALSARRPKA